LIDKFNKSNKSINAENFKYVINNMRLISTDLQIKIENKIFDHKLLNIDENITITKIEYEKYNFHKP
jgi:hypothetical protein